MFWTTIVFRLCQSASRHHPKIVAFVVLALLAASLIIASPSAASDSLVPAGLTSLDWQDFQTEVAKLTAVDRYSDDWFGFYVSVSGDTAVVGAHQSDVGGNTNQGAAYVFYRDQGGPGTWGQAAKLTAVDGAVEDRFGCSVSLSGDTAVVGSLAAVGGNNRQGAAYVFYRDQGGPDAWGQVAKLTAIDGAETDNFGYSVSVDGDTAVIGAVYADVVNQGQGAAYVFYRDQGGPDAWGQVAKLTAVDGDAYDWLGYSVSLSGDTAVVGAMYADVGGNIRQGAAYVFYRDQGGPDAWGQVAKLTAVDGAANDQFGKSVSVDGDTVLVGAKYADIGVDQGAAYVFYRDQGGPGAWGQAAKLIAADGAALDQFGFFVSVSRDTAVVGAPYADFLYRANEGAAYVFYRDQGGPDAWGQVAKLTAGNAEDYFGVSVSVDGVTAVVGAIYADVCGAAYVFTSNQPPVIGIIVGPTEPVGMNTEVQVSASFIDPDAGDTHIAMWNWGDGITSDGIVDDGGGMVSGSHTYNTAGIYTVQLTLCDAAGECDQAIYQYVVVYDPNAGFVTGGGWIYSTAGAYVTDPTLEGKANFGFVSKYKKGATVPEGQTEFQFQDADLNFHSSSYDWLVVTGSNYAKFKGLGTINGEGEYKFQIWAGDGTGDNGEDTFRIKIWYEENGAEIAVYDNGMDQAIDGGSIVVHTK